LLVTDMMAIIIIIENHESCHPGKFLLHHSGWKKGEISSSVAIWLD
jgi:hypothetical protein